MARTRFTLINSFECPKTGQARGLAEITTVNIYGDLGGGLLALKHKSTTVRRQNQSFGQPDIPVELICGGLNVLTREPVRLYSWGCPDAVTGDGPPYLTAGNVIEIPDAEGVPAHLVGRLLRLVEVRGADKATGIIDPRYNYVTDMKPYFQVFGLTSDFEEWGPYCDTAKLEDEGGTWAELAAAVDVRTLPFTVREAAWAGPTFTFWKGGPSSTDSALTPVLSLPASGQWFFAEDLAGSCLIGRIQWLSRMSLPSTPNDVEPLASAMQAAWTSARG